MLSALPPLATGERTFRIGRFVPNADIPAGICGRYAYGWERLTGDPCGVVK
jgi:hypothetical protein